MVVACCLFVVVVVVYCSLIVVGCSLSVAVRCSLFSFGVARCCSLLFVVVCCIAVCKRLVVV